MVRPRFAVLFPLFAFVSLIVFFASSPAIAEDRKIEKDAKELQRKAIEEDNLQTDYENAAKKLQTAITKCGSDKCTAVLKAQLYRDLGAMQILNKAKDEGVASFAEALKLDAGLSLDPSYKTPELEQLWEAAKKGGKGASKGGSGEPSGDFTHTPAVAQQIRTPLPVYVEYSGSESIVKVMVRYKGFGMTEFKPLELQKMGKGWGGVIPCGDVTEGDARYYVQGFNAENDPVATSGSRNEPFRVPVKRAKVDDPPHLPGAEPPKQCQDTGDCPPDFPGCKRTKLTGEDEQASKKDEGEFCEDNAQCKSNVCREERCVGGAVEDDGSKQKKKKFRRIWIGLGLSVDFTLVNSANNACLLKSGASGTNVPGEGEPVNDGWYCTNSDGGDFPRQGDRTENDALDRTRLNQVNGGMVPLQNPRVLLTFDVAATENILVGGRFGYVFNTFPGKQAPTAFAPLHFEVRGTYVFGRAPLMNDGLAPLAFVGAGYAEHSAKVDVNVAFTTGPGTHQKQAWAVSGPAFVSVGVGGRYGMGQSAIVAAIKGTGAIGAAGFLPIISPEVGFQLGF